MSPAAAQVQPDIVGLTHQPRLTAEAFACVVRRGDVEEALGQVAGDDALPKAIRRRMSAFDLMAARCIVGLARAGQDEDIVFASRYGNMAVTLELLTQIVGGELLSPARFSVSVHNAAAGVVSQIVRNRAGHTAIAAMERSAAAGLTEAWARIAEGAPSVIFAYGDQPLMASYDASDEPGPELMLAVRFSVGSAGVAHQLEDGREGAEALARALAGGVGRVTWRP